MERGEGVVRFGEALTFDVMNNASLKYLFNGFYFNVYIAAFELSFFFIWYEMNIFLAGFFCQFQLSVFCVLACDKNYNKIFS